MTKAEEVRKRRLCARRSAELYYLMVNAVDTRVVQVFDFILEVFDRNTDELIFTDICLFEGRTLNIKEYSIHEDGLYHFEEKILQFEKNVNVELWMIELKCYIDKQDGYFARRLPYQRYHNEPLTHYLQIGIK